MKPSTNSKQNSSTSPKNKKHSKEREKRRSEYQNYAPSRPLDVSELIEIAFMGDNKRYVRLEGDSVLNYAAHSMTEQPSNEICFHLAEDLSSKLRHIIHDSITKAHLSGRTSLMASDIDATMVNLNVDKVYGASNYYKFSGFTDKDKLLYYLDDNLVNLTDLAEETGSFLQPGNVIMTKNAYPEITLGNQTYAKYFEKICTALISNGPKSRYRALLAEVRKNAFIGPIVNWFYNYSYFLLDKYITYDSVAFNALDLLVSLEANPIAVQLVSEEVLSRLVRVIFQRLTRNRLEDTLIRAMCRVLGLFATRVPLNEIISVMVMEHLNMESNTSNVHEINTILNIVNQLDRETIYNLMMTYFGFFQNSEDVLRVALMDTFIILGRNLTNAKSYVFYLELSALLEFRLWPILPYYCHCEPITDKDDIRISWRKKKIKMSKKSLRGKRYYDKEVILTDFLHAREEAKVVASNNYRIQVRFTTQRKVFIEKHDFGARAMVRNEWNPAWRLNIIKSRRKQHCANHISTII